ncbi:MAG: hypothetical protein AB7L09_00675 [Nitrospira sp.]
MSDDTMNKARLVVLAVMALTMSIGLVIPTWFRPVIVSQDEALDASLRTMSDDELTTLIVKEQRKYNQLDSMLSRTRSLVNDSLYEVEKKLKQTPDDPDLIRKQVRLRVETARLDKIWTDQALPLKRRVESAQRVLNQRVVKTAQEN